LEIIPLAVSPSLWRAVDGEVRAAQSQDSGA
jgi:hypothetical protein